MNSGDLKDVLGLEYAKRALEICVAGGHRLRFSGSDGSGANLLAQCLKSILPSVDAEDDARVVRHPARAEMQVRLEPIHIADLRRPTETSDEVRGRVWAARLRQVERQSILNGKLKAAELVRVAPLDRATTRMLENAVEKTGMPTRDVIYAIRVARTIADLDACKNLSQLHLSEAFIYVYPGRGHMIQRGLWPN